MTGSVTGIRRRRTVAGRRETSHLPPDRAFYGQTLINKRSSGRPKDVADALTLEKLREKKKNG